MGQDLFARIGVTDGNVARLQRLQRSNLIPFLLHGGDLGFAQIVFSLQGCQCSDADNISLDDHAELVHSQDQVHHLVPGHRFIQRKGHLTAHIPVNGKVFAADFPKNAKDIFDVGFEKIQRDPFTRVLFDTLGYDHGLIRIHQRPSWFHP